MAKQPKVSVVVPIYNVEKYLRECIDSILAQTLEDIEVILVDDGSPDNCGKIIDEYAKTDSRVVAVHQENGGYSVAVNHGIDLAKGEYIGIIESDDFIEPDMYECLYADAHKNNTDVTKGGFYFYNPTLDEPSQNAFFINASGIDLRLAPSTPFTISEWPKLMAFHASIWSSIYRADFVKKIKIPVTAGASYQDFPFMAETLSRAKRISVVKKAFVHWRNEPNQGNSTSAKGKKLLLMTKNTATALEIVKKYGVYEDVREAIGVHVIWANIGFFYNIEKKYQRTYYKNIHKVLMEFKNDSDFKGEFFTPADRKFFNLMTLPNWELVRLRMFAGRVKHWFQRLLLAFMPTYRATIYVKEQSQLIVAQNAQLLDELHELKKKVRAIESAQRKK
ncbi:MAG: glycosyltransferase [Candidatus Saccharibacteria bacterium]|nr:glycosyltransferase [Candidatus Saccharibacteria bacterium]